jgi:hypothetical protein
MCATSYAWPQSISGGVEVDRADGLVAPVLDLLGMVKVDQLDAAAGVRDHDVIVLEVSMHPVVRVEVGQRTDYLRKEPHQVVLDQADSPLDVVMQVLAERNPADLHSKPVGQSAI